MVALTQLSLKLKLPEHLIYTPVLLELLDSRANVAWSLPANIKALGGLGKDGKIDWLKVGRYLATIENHLVTAVRHVSSGITVTLPEGANISDKWVMVDNHDDMGCYFQLVPLPPVPLCSFFDEKSGKGPYALTQYAGKPKELEKDSRVLFDAWEARLRRGVVRTVIDEDIETGVQEHKKQVHQKQMAKARQAATDMGG
jgi:hypothetical protein